MATDYINFRNYPQMTNCVIGDKIQLHSTDFSNKYNSMKNLISGDTPPM